MDVRYRYNLYLWDPLEPAGQIPRSDVAGLLAFVTVARTGAVARAARALARTQPSISARLAGLEDRWGTRLFRRAARGMVLTPEGARLLPLAEAALRNLEELDRAAGLPVGGGVELRVGAGDALGRELLPRALSALLDERPGLEVELREGSGPRLLEALRDGEIDLALVVGPVSGPLVDGLELRPLVRSPVDLLAPHGLLPPARRAPSLRALRDRRWVTLQRDSGFRRHLEAAFSRAGLSFHPAVEVGNLSLVRRFVAAGLGVAAVPAIAFSGRDRSSRVDRSRLAGVSAVPYLSASRAGVPLPSATKRLLDVLAADRLHSA